MAEETIMYRTTEGESDLELPDDEGKGEQAEAGEAASSDDEA